ncbi:hypothetical protein TraAM80_01676 [Trypanosoma rangeli]|uniref:Uncharacterized protein n=1 Tax=Trypanosoma rangeli TaxID=5698 RepID=A0A3R7KUW6_TRYRA|nr:uncharacterized protein TraAM80_01676 [Trypanosoma rangeli]RNF10237.1 hypothetical protein TraAM80_01676 [Trypanosoma rangeli]|eukprot:RNF10237.1 hypothetical protein TraAM80_01676 [Trypanosoma rangeli]
MGAESPTRECGDAAVAGDPTAFTSDMQVTESPPPLPAPASSPATSSRPARADVEDASPWDDAAIEESRMRSSAAVSMFHCGAGSVSTCLEGSMLGETVLLSQSTQRRLHTMSSSVVAPCAAPPAPLDTINKSNSGSSTQKNQDCTDVPSITVSLANSINDGPSPWRRVQLVQLPASNVAGGSPMPMITSGAASDTATPADQHADQLKQYPVQTDSGAPPEASNSERNVAASVSDGDRTPQREASPSRPQSSVCSTGDAPRQMNLSGMSNSMSFRPPVTCRIPSDLPKGSPLVFDGSLKSTTPTRATPVVTSALHQPKPHRTNRGTPMSGSQFVSAFCKRRSSFAPGSGLPFSRGVMGGSGGNALRTSVIGHAYADPLDMASMAKCQMPPVASVPDTGVFEPWLPLGHEPDVPAAEASGWVPLGLGLQPLEQSSNDLASAPASIVVGDKDGDAECNGAEKKSLSPSRCDVRGLGFSVGEEGGISCGSHSMTMMEGTVLEMNLGWGSISASVLSPANSQVTGAADAKEEEDPAVLTPATCKDVADQAPLERCPPSLRSRLLSQVNVEPRDVGKQDAAAAVSLATAQPTEVPVPTWQE